MVTAHRLSIGVTTIEINGTIQVYNDGAKIIISYQPDTSCKIADFKYLNRGQGMLNTNIMNDIQLQALATLHQLDAPKLFRKLDGKFRWDIGEVVLLKFGPFQAIPAMVHAAHAYSGCDKYDLSIAALTDDGYVMTRIYNVEERWLIPQVKSDTNI